MIKWLILFTKTIAGRNCWIWDNGNSVHSESSQLVLVFFSWWYRARLGTEVLVDAVGVATFQYKMSWLETGGFRKSEPSYSQARYSIHCSDLKPFYLGEDRFIEPPTVEDDALSALCRHALVTVRVSELINVSIMMDGLDMTVHCPR